MRILNFCILYKCLRMIYIPNIHFLNSFDNSMPMFQIFFLNLFCLNFLLAILIWAVSKSATIYQIHNRMLWFIQAYHNLWTEFRCWNWIYRPRENDLENISFFLANGFNCNIFFSSYIVQMLMFIQFYFYLSISTVIFCKSYKVNIYFGYFSGKFGDVSISGEVPMEIRKLEE